MDDTEVVKECQTCPVSLGVETEADLWLGMGDSNPRFLIQSQASYHWTNPHWAYCKRAWTNLLDRISRTLVKGSSDNYSINGLIGCQGPDRRKTWGLSLTTFSLSPRIP